MRPSEYSEHSDNIRRFGLFSWHSKNLSQGEDLLLARCSKEIGNVPIVEKRLPNSLLNPRLTDQYIAGTAGQNEELRDLDDK